MKYIVIGGEFCSKCKIIKGMLEQKKIDFQYFYMDDLNEDDRTFYTTLAINSGMLSLPIIYDTEQKIVVTIEEITE